MQAGAGVRALFISISMVLLIGVLSCTKNDSKREHGKIPYQMETGVLSKNHGNSIGSSPLLAKMKKAEKINEVLQVQRFVKLEVTEQSIIANISDVVFQNGFWFIADDMQGLVLQFDEYGEFVRQIGRRGEGPGEYFQPSNLRRVGSNKVAVFDRQSGRVNIYSIEGIFERSIHPFKDLNIALRDQFIINDSDKLFSPSFPTHDIHEPHHIIFDISKRKPSVIWGFGKRFSPFEEFRVAGGGSWPVTAFNVVGANLWVGDAFSTDIEIYDLEGREIKTVKSGLVGLERSDFDGVNLWNETEHRELFLKRKVQTVFQVGGAAIASYLGDGGFVYNLFDLQGKLLQKGLKGAPVFKSFLDSTEDFIVDRFPMEIDEVKFYQKFLSEKEYLALQEAGWDPGNFSNDNPYLVVANFGAEDVIY